MTDIGWIITLGLSIPAFFGFLAAFTEMKYNKIYVGEGLTTIIGACAMIPFAFDEIGFLWRLYA